jgi:Arc/MetJ-type ribon-helix-helix transcriptional regulator
MATKTRKLNFSIDEDLCRAMEELIPSGQRSRVVNDALRRELARIRRQRAVEELKAAPRPSTSLTNDEIVTALAHDRASH